MAIRGAFNPHPNPHNSHLFSGACEVPRVTPRLKRPKYNPKNRPNHFQFTQGIQRTHKRKLPDFPPRTPTKTPESSEPGVKKDWGGEKNDLHTTRLRLKNSRLGAAFAFKGPGKKAKKLVPGMMGKNGDQIQRLFQTDAEVFFVQYWREIDESVLEQMRSFAVVKSIADGNRVYYGVIDGTDSYRLYRAYPNDFSSGSKNKNR
jgi:hypothetical protein